MNRVFHGEVSQLGLWISGDAGVKLSVVNIYFLAAALALKRKLSFPVSRMRQRHEMDAHDIVSYITGAKASAAVTIA